MSFNVPFQTSIVPTLTGHRANSRNEESHIPRNVRNVQSISYIKSQNRKSQETHQEGKSDVICTTAVVDSREGARGRGWETVGCISDIAWWEDLVDDSVVHCR